MACAVFPGLNPSTTVNYQPPAWSRPTRSWEGWAPPGYQFCAEPTPGRPAHSSQRVPVLPALQPNPTSEREVIDMHILAKASNSENPELRFCMFQRASLNGRLSYIFFFFLLVEGKIGSLLGDGELDLFLLSAPVCATVKAVTCNI